MYPDQLDYDQHFNFGFSLLRDKQHLKLRLDAAGREGVIGFIKALMSSGICDKQSIVEEILDVTGGHAESAVEDLLFDQQDIHWREVGNGIYAVIETHELF